MQDYEIIKNDRIINFICKVLSEFGKRARYFNLDLVFGIKQTFNSHEEWEKIETELLKKDLGKKGFYLKLEQNKLDELYDNSGILLVTRLELFIRALTRQFIFGNFSSESKTFVFQIQEFSDIDDNQIGRTDYRRMIK